MQERLDDIERQYEELTRELSSPGVASDPARLRELGKQHAELSQIVTLRRARQHALSQAEEARLMAKEEREPEMAEYFRSEGATAERRADQLTKELQALLAPKDPNDEKNVVLEIRAGTG